MIFDQRGSAARIFKCLYFLKNINIFFVFLFFLFGGVHDLF